MAKILVVDDERSIRNSMKEVLEFEGHVVTLAEDGENGLKEAEKVQFDLVFSDIKMPKMDGIELLAKMRQLQPSNHGVPIELYFFTATSAWVEYETIQASYSYAKAAFEYTDVVTAYPGSNGATDFQTLVDELLEKL